MSKYKRRQLFVDPRVQGTLLLRAVSYWLYCLLAVGLMLLCWRIYTRPGLPFASYVEFVWLYYCPAMAASLFLLPVVVMDSLRLSNRFAGPILRLRRSMKRLAAGERVNKIYFRDGDFWIDMALDFNTIAGRLQTDEAVAVNNTANQPVVEEEPLGV